MNVLKHMETVFVVALATASAASIAVEGIHPAETKLPVIATNTVVPANLAVVHVTARRLSAAEKRASLDAERVSASGVASGVGRA